ncbi:MAG: BtpA/SgcQ family protein [Acidilobaceae archaeon]
MGVSLFRECKPLIGVIHLPPLPGSPGYRRSRFPDVGGSVWSIEKIVEYAVSQAKIYENAGFDGVIIENYGDKPYNVRAGAGQAAALSRIVYSTVREVSIPVGVNVLWNSGYEAVYVAHVSGASFIRVYNLCELRVSQEGILYPEARRVAKALGELGAYEDIYSGNLSIMTDVSTRQTIMQQQPIDMRAIIRDCVERCGIPIHAIIISGARIGEEPGYDATEAARTVTRDIYVKLFMGSGVSHINISKYWELVDGFIVGTSVKLGNRVENPVSEEKAASLAKLVKHYRSAIGCS